jgi:CBS-domain-containing membrane protein
VSTTPHTVSDVMTHAVVAVGRDARFKEIVEAMQKWKVSALPVLEGDGRVVGVVSEADLLPKEAQRESDPSRLAQLQGLTGAVKAEALTADQLMSAPAITVHADATLAEAARTMAQRRVKRLPVVDAGGILRGVVSRADLLKVFLRSDDEIAAEVRREVITPLFGPASPSVDVSVTEGVVVLRGSVDTDAPVPVAVRLARAVEGVVNVECHLSGHPDPSASPVSGPLF